MLNISNHLNYYFYLILIIYFEYQLIMFSEFFFYFFFFIISILISEFNLLMYVLHFLNFQFPTTVKNVYVQLLICSIHLTLNVTFVHTINE